MKRIARSFLACLLLATTASQAATIQFDLTTATIAHDASNHIQYPFTVESDGVTLTGTEFPSERVYLVNPVGVEFWVQQSAENIQLQFDEDVTIQSLSFLEVNGTMTFSVNGGDTFQASVGTVSLPDPIAIAANTPFVIHGEGTDNGFYAEMNAITVITVPEPAVGAMLLGAFALAGLRRRRG